MPLDDIRISPAWVVELMRQLRIAAETKNKIAEKALLKVYQADINERRKGMKE